MSADPARKLITILVPVYNEEPNIRPLYEAVCAAMRDLEADYAWELLFTDNHSEDRTFEILAELAAGDGRIRALRFSRNFGFQRSIYTGYVNARGDAVVQLDADLQDPPALIAEFVRHWEDGCDVVYGVRRGRHEGAMITGLRKVFYRTIDYLSEDRLPHDAGDFRLISRRVVDAIREVDDYHPYLRGMIAAFGYRQVGVPYDRDARHRGQSKFPLKALINLAVDGILAHSIVPLRLATVLGLAMSLVTLIGAGFYVLTWLLSDSGLPAGFTTTTILLLLSISLNAMFLGIIGEYLGRIYQQVKKRPITLIERRLGD